MFRKGKPVCRADFSCPRSSVRPGDSMSLEKPRVSAPKGPKGLGSLWTNLGTPKKTTRLQIIWKIGHLETSAEPKKNSNLDSNFTEPLRWSSSLEMLNLCTSWHQTCSQTLGFHRNPRWALDPFVDPTSAFVFQGRFLPKKSIK